MNEKINPDPLGTTHNYYHNVQFNYSVVQTQNDTTLKRNLGTKTLIYAFYSPPTFYANG